jgi:hypothetical protein
LALWFGIRNRRGEKGGTRFGPWVNPQPSAQAIGFAGVPKAPSPIAKAIAGTAFFALSNDVHAKAKAAEEAALGLAIAAVVTPGGFIHVGQQSRG